MRTIWARIGQPVTLPCDLEEQSEDGSSSSLAQLEWRKNGTMIFNAFGTEPGFSAPEYQGRLAKNGRGLTIHSVQSDDQSLFLCTLTRFTRGTTAAGGRENGQFVRLVVHSMPRILEPLDGTKIFAKEGSPIRRECLVDGIPTPNVKWKWKMRNGTLETISDTFRLSIGKLTAANEGEYLCEAENFEGTAHSTMAIKIRKPLRISRENPSMVNKTLAEGSSVFWHCAIDDQKVMRDGKVQIKWTKNGKAITNLEIGLRAHIDGGDFGIMHLRRTDSGEYECTATYLDTSEEGLLESDRIIVHLNVQYKPEISTKTRRFHTIVSGAKSELDCLIDAIPPPIKVRWTKNGRELNGHNEKMEEGNLMRSTVPIEAAHLHGDAGIYTCEAENAIGKSGSPVEIHVVVAEAPKFTKMPAPEYHARIGQRIVMECEGFAEVPIKRVWTRIGGGGGGVPITFSDSNSSKFVIANVTHSDHGLYRCSLLNSIATVSRDVHLFADDTIPQCATNFGVHCEGEQSFSLDWTPGYGGGNYSQLFRIFYRKIHENAIDDDGEEWKVTEFTNHAKMRLDEFERFSEYELKLEASNRFGEINCTIPGRHNTCTKLSSPLNVLLENANFDEQKVPLLSWDRVGAAKAYKIKYRKFCDEKERRRGSFHEIAQTTDTKYKLPLERFGLIRSQCCLDFVVHSVRVPFPASDASTVVTYPNNACSSLSPSTGSSSALLFLLLLSSLFGILLLLSTIFCSLQRFLAKRRTKSSKFVVNKQKESLLGQQIANGYCCDGHHQRHFDGNCGCERRAPFGNSFNYSSSRCASTSTSTSLNAHCAFGHPIAITRKLFPENYICTNFAQFDEEEEEAEGRELLSTKYSTEEYFGSIPNSDVPFLVDYNDNNNNNNNESSKGRWPSISENYAGSSNGGSKSTIYLEMNAPFKKDDAQSIVGEMLREKYIFAQTEKLNALEEMRIEQLRRELANNCAG